MLDAYTFDSDLLLFFGDHRPTLVGVALATASTTAPEEWKPPKTDASKIDDPNCVANF